MAATFGAFLGPFSGVLMAAAVSGPDAKLYINAITTLVFFVLSLALVIRPSMRILSRLWLVAGFAWVLAGWITYFRKEFSEMACGDRGSKLRVWNAWLHPPLHHGPHLCVNIHLTAAGGRASTSPAMLMHCPPSIERVLHQLVLLLQVLLQLVQALLSAPLLF